jgi:hypothetical protein
MFGRLSIIARAMLKPIQIISDNYAQQDHEAAPASWKIRLLYRLP